MSNDPFMNYQQPFRGQTPGPWMIAGAAPQRPIAYGGMQNVGAQYPVVHGSTPNIGSIPMAKSEAMRPPQAGVWEESRMRSAVDSMQEHKSMVRAAVWKPGRRELSRRNDGSYISQVQMNQSGQPHMQGHWMSASSERMMHEGPNMRYPMSEPPRQPRIMQKDQILSQRRPPLRSRSSKQTQWIDRTGKQVERPDYQGPPLTNSAMEVSHKYAQQPLARPPRHVGDVGGVEDHMQTSNRPQYRQHARTMESKASPGLEYAFDPRRNEYVPVPVQSSVPMDTKRDFHPELQRVWQDREPTNGGFDVQSEWQGDRRMVEVEEVQNDRLQSMCEHFLAWYSQHQPSNTIVVEEIATLLGQDFQRMVDIMEILCSLGIVSNADRVLSYDWEGLQGLQAMMYNLIREHEQERKKSEMNRTLPKERFTIPAGSKSLLVRYNKEKEEDLSISKVKEEPKDEAEIVKDIPKPTYGNEVEALRTSDGRKVSGTVNQAIVMKEAERTGPFQQKEMKRDTAGAIAKAILKHFVTGNSRAVPLNDILSLFIDNSLHENDYTDGPRLRRIRDAIDVLGALELVEVMDSGNGGDQEDLRLVWVGNDILQVNDSPEKVFDPRMQWEMENKVQKCKPMSKGGSQGSDKIGDSSSSRRMPRYLKKSLAAMRRRRVGGRFAASVDKETNENTDESRNFFAISRDDDGIPAVQSLPFRHSAWSFHHGRVGIRSCRCIKSRCENRYCDCFASGAACLNCSCVNCGNTQKPTKRRRLITRGCRCMKSRCSKGHCDCFAAGKGCTARCQCANCENPLGSQADAASSSKPAENSTNKTLRQGILVLTQSKNSAFKYVGKKDEEESIKSLSSRSKRQKNSRSRRVRALTAAAMEAKSKDMKYGKRKRIGDTKTSRHFLIGKNYLRVVNGVGETGIVSGWQSPKKTGGKAFCVVRFKDGEKENLSEEETRRGVREWSLKPGKKVKILQNGKWIHGTIRKVLRTAATLRPFGVKLDSRGEGRLTWVSRDLVKHIDDEDYHDHEDSHDVDDDADSDTSPESSMPAPKPIENDLLDGNDDDDGSATPAEEELLDHCYVPGEHVEWKYGNQWVKAEVKNRVTRNTKSKGESYAIEVLDEDAKRTLKDSLLSSVLEKFLRPREESSPRKPGKDIDEFKLRAQEDLHLILRLRRKNRV